ncbi:MAG: hypothetical protein ABIP48_01620 [Planctomycetota bacterium]
MTRRARGTPRPAAVLFPAVVRAMWGSSVLWSVFLSVLARAEDPNAAFRRRNDLVEPGRFIQIPGPNPILRPGEEGAWDDGVIEAADALNDRGTYYFYYHATGAGKGYRLGVATAPDPLGPFRKQGDKPILELGPKGSWDDRHVACAMILKEGIDKYLMWYSGLGASGEHPKWSIGLAAAPDPLGPWTKHPKNPVLEDFGYVGGVVKVRGKYYLYTAYPIGSTGPDYSPMALAIADQPAGPWTRWSGNPVLKEGEWGEWDDGGFSEAEVLYSGGVFHMFYGGAKLFPERIRSRESIGYAYSLTGYDFIKYGRNPVAAREANPNGAAFSEVHAIFESPFIYLYHTLRYREPPSAEEREKFPGVEHLGVQVLVTSTPFRLDMPVLGRGVLAPKTATLLADSPPVCLAGVERVALTAECVYSRKTNSGVQVHVHSSYDGVRYDTTPLHSLVVPLKPGELVRKTFELDTAARFIKVLVENLDPAESVADVKITATLGG